MTYGPRTRTTFLAIAALALCAGVERSALAIGTSDDFNRPNGTNMGPNWVEVAGNTVIDNNQGRGGSGAFNQGWMRHSTFTASYIHSIQAVDFLASGTSQAVVLMAGLNPSTWGCVSVKLQDNTGDGLFDRVFFEQAFNAGSWGSGVPVKYDLATPTASGRMTVYFSTDGDVAFCEIQNDASALTETFSATGILSFAFPITGTNFGIGHTGAPFFDDWTVQAYKPKYGVGCPGSGGHVPEMNTTTFASAGAPFDLEITKGLGGAPCVFFFGLAQAQIPMGGTGCNLLITPLLPPSFTVPLGGVGPGNGSITLNATMPAVAGVTFTMQAFIADPGVSHGFCATNGLMIELP